MGLFGDSDDETREEVTLGLSDEKEESSNGDSEVRDVNLDIGDTESNGDDSSLREEVEQKVGASTERDFEASSDTGVDLDDVYEQNEEIKRKLDAIMSAL